MSTSYADVLVSIPTLLADAVIEARRRGTRGVGPGTGRRGLRATRTALADESHVDADERRRVYVDEHCVVLPRSLGDTAASPAVGVVIQTQVHRSQGHRQTSRLLNLQPNKAIAGIRLCPRFSVTRPLTQL